jgi:hypothetical protein
VKGAFLKLELNPKKTKEIDAVMDDLASDYQKRMDQAERIIKKRKSSKNDKTHVALEARIAYSDYHMERQDLLLGFCTEYLQKRLSDVEAIIQSITDKLNLDLPKVKEEMKSLKETLSSPEVSTVANFIKRALAREAEIRAEYEKKMRENDLAT